MVKLVPGVNDLATTRPDLAARWHPSRNGDLTPQMITAGSGKKVWWQCRRGHEWQAVVNNRGNDHACPVCSGHQVLVGFNDLATVNPTLAAQWHPTKNGGLTPEMVTAYSNKKVWWICEEGHEWEAIVANRSKGRECPYCRGNKVWQGFNDLATVNPELAAQWHPTKNGSLTAQMVTKGSQKKVWWRCELGHEWEAAIHSRNSGVGCPHCWHERRVSFAEKAFLFYIQKFFPDAEGSYHAKWLGRMELDVYIPSIKVAIEYDGPKHKDPKKDLKKNRRCEKHGVRLIRVREPGLPILFVECVFRKSVTSHRDLALTIKTVLCKCLQVNSNIDINIDRDRAEIYKLMRLSKKEMSLAVINAKLAAEWHPTKNGNLTPDMVLPHSNKKVWWRCEQGHEWQAPVSNRMSGTGCPYCSGHKVWQGFNDLATTHPKLAEEWNTTKNGSLTPHSVTHGSYKKVWWKCSLGHEWEAKIYQRAHHDNQCPYCANKKAWPEFNDLQTGRPDLAAEWHPTKNGDFTPNMFTVGSGKKVWWLCPKCGHEWEAQIAHRSRSKNGSGCPECAKKKMWDTRRRNEVSRKAALLSPTP